MVSSFPTPELNNVNRGYDIALYAPDSRDAILQLQTHHWSEDLELNSAYFQWKYEANPYLREPLIALALSKGEVVAMRGLWGARWCCPSGHILDVPCAGDVVVAPEHRNRGLFEPLNEVALGEASRRGHTTVLNLSAGAPTYWNSVTTGWRRVSAAPSLTSGWIEFDGDPLAALENQCGNDNGLALETNPDPRELGELVAGSPVVRGIRHLRDATYFAWRFGNPLARYRFLTCRRSGLEGFLVLQSAVSRPHSWVNLIDWSAPSRRVLEDLLRQLLEWARPPEIRAWADTQDEAFTDTLVRLGFRVARRRSNQGPFILARSTDTAAANQHDGATEDLLFDAKAWDFRMIYSDGY